MFTLLLVALAVYSATAAKIFDADRSTPAITQELVDKINVSSPYFNLAGYTFNFNLKN